MFSHNGTLRGGYPTGPGPQTGHASHTVTALHPSSGHSSSCVKGWANKLRSDEKIKKQQDIDNTAPGERSSTDQFHPTVFETHGRWSKGSTNFFKMIFSEVAKNEPSERLHRMTRYWHNIISFAVARSDA